MRPGAGGTQGSVVWAPRSAPAAGGGSARARGKHEEAGGRAGWRGCWVLVALSVDGGGNISSGPALGHGGSRMSWALSVPLAAAGARERPSPWGKSNFRGKHG